MARRTERHGINRHRGRKAYTEEQLREMIRKSTIKAGETDKEDYETEQGTDD
jgi:hypothetical protein